MPIYEYRADDRGCALCTAGFDRLERMADPPQTTCPDCGGACHRVISVASVAVGSAHVLREKHVAQHGFSQYRRVEKGRYEKTAGSGPDTFSA